MKNRLSFYLPGLLMVLLTACTDQPAPAEQSAEEPPHTTQALSPADSLLLAGKTLFYDQCASCHAICSQIVGPQLSGVTKKYKKEWLYAFTRSSQEMIKKGDKKAVKVFKEFNKTVMLSFPSLTDRDLEAIYTFVESHPCPEPPVQTDVSIP